MAVELLDNEKVLYTKDYAKGRSHTVATVIVTDKRVIHSVEGKKCAEKTEIKIGEVTGVSTRFIPSNLATAIAGLILTILYVAYIVLSTTLVPSGSEVGELYAIVNYLLYIELAIGVLCLVIGIIKLRTGLYVVLYSNGNQGMDVISVSSVKGKVRLVWLRTNKLVAKDIADGISAAIKSAKAD